MAAPLITIAEARELVLGATRPLGTELVAIGEAAHGRVLAVDLTAAGDVPPFPCSAMDGYAIIPGDAGRTLTVVGESRAGTPARAGARRTASAIRISTGGAIPDGATAVIPQEDVDDPRRHDPDPGRGDRRRARPQRRRGHARGRDRAPAGTTLGARRARSGGRRRRGRADRLPSPPGPGAVHRRRAPRSRRAARPRRDPQLERADARRARHRGRARSTATAAAAARRPGRDRGRTRRRTRERRRGDRHRRRLGRSARPRQARARRTRRRGGVLAGRAPARQADLVRPPRRHARVRPAGQSGVGRRHVRLFVRPALRRTPGAERGRLLETEAVLGDRGPPQPRPRAGGPRAPRAPERRARRHAQRAAGLPHRHLAARRGRARVRARRRGRAGGRRGGDARAAFRADTIRPCPCSSRPWQRSPRWCRVGGGAGARTDSPPHRDRLPAAVDGDRARRRRPLGPVGRADAGARGLQADVERHPPREPGADLLAVPLARDPVD